jgi:hypothetical protein
MSCLAAMLTNSRGLTRSKQPLGRVLVHLAWSNDERLVLRNSDSSDEFQRTAGSRRTRQSIEKSAPAGVGRDAPKGNSFARRLRVAGLQENPQRPARPGSLFVPSTAFKTRWTTRRAAQASSSSSLARAPASRRTDRDTARNSESSEPPVTRGPGIRWQVRVRGETNRRAARLPRIAVLTSLASVIWIGAHRLALACAPPTLSANRQFASPDEKRRLIAFSHVCTAWRPFRCRGSVCCVELQATARSCTTLLAASLPSR